MQKPFDQIQLHAISKAAQAEMQDKLDNLSKPIKGLGQLERLADKLAGIQETTDLKIDKRICLVYCADHGIVSEAVSATSEPLSNVLSANVAEGHACVNALAMRNRCEVKVFDIGLAGGYQTTKMVNEKIQRGTKNMLTSDAMSRQDAVKSIQTGYDNAKQAIADGNQLLLLGEVGLGNTSASSAIVSTMLALPVDDVVDKGSDISVKQFEHKKQVIKDILTARRPDKADPLGVLSKVGGFEIGATVGTMIAGAEAGVPVIMDGFISDAAAVLAKAFYPDITGHLIASHLSGEKGAQRVLDYLDLKPLLQLGMAVGEGTGAVVALALVDDIQSVLINMNTLQDLNFEYEN